MKVLLIQAFTKNAKPVFPVGLARVAAAIQGKYQLAVFDPNIETRVKDILTERLEGFNPDVIGISLRNIDSIDYVARQYFYPDFTKLLKCIKMIKPNRKIIVGGSGFSLFASEIMQANPEIDIGVFLEGEESFPELLDEIDAPLRVKGLLVRRKNEIQFTGRRNLIDFSNSPDPAYKCFDMARYISKGGSIGIEGKRGCVLKCSYCPYPFLTGKHVRIRTAKAIVDEMEFLVSNYGARNFEFVDSVFNIPAEHAQDVCREILARGLEVRWSCWSNVKTFDEKYARLTMDAGCQVFFLFTDGFSDNSLNALGKNYTQKDILNTVETAKKVDNLRVCYGFFLNPPGITIKEIFQMISFLLRTKLAIGKKMRLGRVFLFNQIRIEPYTQMRERAIKEGIIKSDTSLLRPVYYTHPSARYIRLIYNILTWPLGWLIRFRRFLRFGFRKL